MKYNRSISELEKNAVLWWPEVLSAQNSAISIIPQLLKSQDDFLDILSLAKDNPFQVFDILSASKFPANLFLKHLSVLADYGGEPLQRLGRSFDQIFPNKKMLFTWDGSNCEYKFSALPIKGLGNKKLKIDGDGLTEKETELSDLYKDVIMILMHGSTSSVCDEAGLLACEIGTLLGKKDLLFEYVKQRYIMVSRITGGATANSLGQLAQKDVVEFLTKELGEKYTVISNGSIMLEGYDKIGGMPFDVVVEREGKKVGIEISFQVTTNSTIERKAGQAADRFQLMKNNGNHIAYILDGAGNFQRSSAISTICTNSECTVAYKDSEFKILAQWIESLYA